MTVNPSLMRGETRYDTGRCKLCQGQRVSDLLHVSPCHSDLVILKHIARTQDKMPISMDAAWLSPIKDLEETSEPRLPRKDEAAESLSQGELLALKQVRTGSPPASLCLQDASHNVDMQNYTSVHCHDSCYTPLIDLLLLVPGGLASKTPVWR